MKQPSYAAAALIALLIAASSSVTLADWEPHDGDAFAFVGEAATVEMRRHGYLEAALTSRFHDRQLRFRNFGWQGDTVYQQLRMPNFADYAHHLREQEISVVVAWFGLLEAFDGTDELGRFARSYGALLSDFDDHADRLLLLGPTQMEDLGGHAPDPAAQNDVIYAYAETARTLAGQRSAPFVDLYNLAEAGPDAPRMTDNGLLPSGYGFWRIAQQAERELGYAPRDWRVRIDASDADVNEATGTRIQNLSADADAIAFQTQDALLPLPRFQPHGRDGVLLAHERRLTVDNLPDGAWTLQVDGRDVAEASAAEWARGVTLTAGPEHEQAEAMLDRINLKNEYFFRYWRPANWDFVFGERMGVPASRRHDNPDIRWFPEELEEYPPLIAELEQEIHDLAQPQPRQYRLIRNQEGR